MSTQTDEIRTTITFDTAGAERGAANVEKAFDRISGAQKKMEGGHGGGGGAGNVTHFFRDLAEGRLTNAAMRLGDALKIGGGAAIGFTLIATAVNKIVEEAGEAKKRMDELYDSSRKASREALFTTSGDGTGSLAAKKKGMEDIRDNASQRMQEWDLQPYKDAGVTGLPYIAKKTTEAAINGSSPEKELAAATQQRDLANANILQLTQKIRAGMNDELAITRLQAAGDEKGIALKREEIGLAKKLAEATEIFGKDSPELKILQEQDGVIRTMIDREQRLKDLRFNAAMDERAADRENLSSWQKKRNLTDAELRAVRAELSLMGNINSEQSRALRLKEKGLEGDLHSQAHAKFLNPDGTRKSPAVLAKERREEAAKDRRLDYFDRHYDDNGRSKTDQKGQWGLRTGNLGSVHMTGATMAGGESSLTRADKTLSGFVKDSAKYPFIDSHGRTSHGTMAMERDQSAGGHSTTEFGKQFERRWAETHQAHAWRVSRDAERDIVQDNMEAMRSPRGGSQLNPPDAPSNQAIQKSLDDIKTILGTRLPQKSM